MRQRGRIRAFRKPIVDIAHRHLEKVVNRRKLGGTQLLVNWHRRATAEKPNIVFTTLPSFRNCE
jgi:hypothetical protein